MNRMNRVHEIFLEFTNQVSDEEWEKLFNILIKNIDKKLIDSLECVDDICTCANDLSSHH